MTDQPAITKTRVDSIHITNSLVSIIRSNGLMHHTAYSKLTAATRERLSNLTYNGYYLRLLVHKGEITAIIRNERNQ